MSSRRLRLRAIAVLTGVLVVAAAPRLAAAKKRVAVLNVKGADSKQLERTLAAIVDECAAVVSAKTYKKAAKRLGARTLKRKHVVKVAARIQADGVLRGWLEEDDDGRYILRVRLYEGASGRAVKKLAVRLRSDTLSKKMRGAITKRLRAAIGDLRPLAPSYDERDDDGDDDDDYEPVVKKKRKRVAVAKKKRARKRAREVEEEEEETEPYLPLEHGDDENPLAPKKRAKKKAKKKKVKKAKKRKPEKKRKKRVARRDYEDEDDGDDGYFGDDDDDSGDQSYEEDAGDSTGASVSIGVGAVSRSLAFTVREGLDNPPEGYSGPIVPSLLVAGEVYPAALSGKKGVMRKIGVGFNLDRVFGLETAVGGGVAATTLPTTQMSYGMEVKFRHQFRKKAYRPTVVASFGFSRLDFQVDKQSAPEGVTVDLPNTSYTYFYPGLEVHLAVKKKVSLSAEFKFPLVTSVGEMQEPEQYGAATITGYDVGGGALYSVSNSLVLQGGVRWLSMAYDFKGTGEQAVNRDGDPSTEDVGGASDRYLGGYLAASYAF